MYCIGQTMSIKYHVQRLIEQFWAATLRPFWRHSLWIRLALVVSDLTLQVTGDHCVFIKITVLLRPRPVHVDIPVQIQRRSWLHTHTTLSIYSTHRVGENMIVHLRGDFSRLNNVNFFMFMHTEDLPRKRVHWPPPPKKKKSGKSEERNHCKPVIGSISWQTASRGRRTPITWQMSLSTTFMQKITFNIVTVITQ